MGNNDGYLIPAVGCAAVSLIGALVAGTSLSTTAVPVVVEGTNRTTVAYVPYRYRDLGLGLGGILTAGGILAFWKVVDDGIYWESLIAESESFNDGDDIGGQPTVLQPTLLDPPYQQQPIPAPIPTQQPTVLETNIAPAPATVLVKEPIAPPPAEQPEYMMLLKENTIILAGREKGSGKTSRAGWFIAEFLKLGAEVKYASAIYHAGQFAGLDIGIIDIPEAVEGKICDEDYSEVERVITWFVVTMQSRARRASKEPNFDPWEEPKAVLVLDEGSDYAANVDQELMGKLWTVATQLTRQFNGVLIFCSHGTTLDMLGGRSALEGKRETLNNGACWLLLKAVTDPKSKTGKRPCVVVEKGRIKGSSDWEKDESFAMHLDATRPPENYDYTELVRKHCPQFIHRPSNTENNTETTDGNDS